MREPRFKKCGKCFGAASINEVECDFCDGSGEVEQGDFYDPGDDPHADTWKEAVGIA